MINRMLNYQFTVFNFQLSGKSLIKNPLFSGSAIMIIGSNLSNFIAYVYHLIIGRLLGPSSYGTLAALLSLMGLVAVSFGFLGTVMGMIKAFYNMASAGNNVDVSLLSSGIYQAMVTTVAGLIVGIIAFVCYNMLVSKVEKLVFILEARATEFMDVLYEPAKK